MIRFNNDYNHGAHNAIIQAIGEIIQNLMRDMEKMSGVRKEPTRSGNILAVQM